MKPTFAVFLLCSALCWGSVAEAGPIFHKMQGKRITLRLNKANVHNVLLLFGEIGNLNIIASGKVKGKLSLSLRNVHWMQAFKLILKMKRLHAVKKGKIVWVMTQSENKVRTTRNRFLSRWLLHPKPVRYGESQGRRFDLKLRGASLRTFLKPVASALQVNLVPMERVQGKVTAYLRNTTWSEALGLVLQTLGYHAKKNDNIVTIHPWARIVQKHKKDLAKQAWQAPDISWARR